MSTWTILRQLHTTPRDSSTTYLQRIKIRIRHPQLTHQSTNEDSVKHAYQLTQFETGAQHYKLNAIISHFRHQTPTGNHNTKETITTTLMKYSELKKLTKNKY
jgi:hypothetical protein